MALHSMRVIQGHVQFNFEIPHSLLFISRSFRFHHLRFIDISRDVVACTRYDTPTIGILRGRKNAFMRRRGVLFLLLMDSALHNLMEDMGDYKVDL